MKQIKIFVFFLWVLSPLFQGGAFGGESALLTPDEKYPPHQPHTTPIQPVSKAEKEEKSGIFSDHLVDSWAHILPFLLKKDLAHLGQTCSAGKALMNWERSRRTVEIPMSETTHQSVRALNTFKRVGLIPSSLPTVHMDMFTSPIPFQNVFELNLSNCPMGGSLKWLSAFPFLERLFLFKTQVLNLEGIQHCPSLNLLNIRKTPITDISPLKGSGVKILIMDKFLFADTNNLSTVLSLKNLEVLSLSGAEDDEIIRCSLQALIENKPHLKEIVLKSAPNTGN